ncbi:unnamed protein product [Caenorhabditis angaria]|uniref:Nuclear receptor domain-containing protein n=1 Tax=Caenorhabditis angaria TaxID=860376 RepID=A0A9P1ISK3_9PELO|nr:unnamed protein product [Caenorhabditis angaria]
MSFFEKCSVCDKKSTGIHYGVQSCDACKSFYLRSMRSNRKYSKCPFDQNCYFAVVSHYKCRECRLKKCIQLGMQIKNQSVTEFGIWKKLEIPFTKLHTLIRNLAHIDSEVAKLRISTYNPIIYPKLENAVGASSILNMASQLPPMSGKEWGVFDILMVIEYAKTFPFFDKLSIQDKCALIKGTHFMITSLTSAFESYLNKKDVLQAPDGLIYDDKITMWDVEVMFGAKIPKNMMCIPINFWTIQYFVQHKPTHEEYLLMKAIAFCNPVNELSNFGKKLIQKERKKFGEALSEYCLKSKNGASRYVTLLEYVINRIRAQKDVKDFAIQKCLVCEEKSNGNHYGAQTCNGCKSFFLRSMGRKVIYSKCPFDRNCYSTVVSHYKCRECRFKKCLKVGMNLGNKSMTCWEIWRDLEIPFTKTTRLLRVLAHIDSEVTKLRISTYNPIIYPNLNDVVKAPSILNLASKLQPMPGYPMQKSESIKIRIKLNKKRIEIENQKKSYDYPVESFSHEEFNIKEWGVFDALMTIEYAKTFPFFEKLDDKDKCVLIQETHFMISSITSGFESYLNKKDALQSPDGLFYDNTLTKSDAEVMFGLNIPDNISFIPISYWTIKNFIQNRLTHEEYLLMKAIAFCHPVMELSDYGRELVQQERNKFANSLLNYCCASNTGVSRYVTIIECVSNRIRAQKAAKDFTAFIRLMSTSTVSTSRKMLEDQIFL